MHIILFRNGNRALLLPAGKDLFDCSPAQRAWLGGPVSESVAELTLGTPMPGIQPCAVLAEIRAHGVCGLDVYGVVRAFPPVTAGPTAPPVLRICYGTKAHHPPSLMVKPE